MQERILKIRIDKTTLKEATELCLKWTKTNFQKQISTPNPEILLEAQRNKKFARVLNHCDLNIPDGIGILWAAKYQKITKNVPSNFVKIIKWFYSLAAIIFHPKYIKDPLKERVSGSNLMLSIAKHSDSENKIFLLGAAPGIAEKTAKVLQKKFSKINIAGHYSGSPRIAEQNNIIEKINKTKAKMLFVAYGAPAQEMWINRNLKKMPTVKVAIGVGGSFDFIAGKRKRAPRWLQKIGLEWLIRLIQEPSRIKRIYRATIKFPIHILRAQLKNN